MQEWKSEAPASFGYQQYTPKQLEDLIEQNIIARRLLTPASLRRFKRDLGEGIADASLSDFQDLAPLFTGVRDPFAASIAEVFLTYAARRTRHDFAKWRAEERGEVFPMTNEQFIARYGPTPWRLLTDTLAIVGLPYRFDPPPEDAEQLEYEVALSSDAGDRIKPSDLSSGEKVLLAIAMGLFTGTSMSEAIELPRLLLLDEADASLHPSMVKSLLTVIEEVFVGQYGVRVMLATHSPSTVALAPEASLYVMNRSAPRLLKVTTDEAMKLLTVGLTSLSVKLENRKQIFVESEYDQAIFQASFALLKNHFRTERSAEFIAAGRRDVGGGCDMVKRLVKELRSAGSSTVLGVVDRDRRQGAPEHIYYIRDRYSIENLVFDPLLLGVFLLREQVMTATQLGLPEHTRNFELRTSHAPALVSAVSTSLNLQDGPTEDVHYLGGFTLSIPQALLEMPGHTLEERVVETFPQLKAHQKDLKRQIINRAAGDVPAFIPKSLFDLLEELLNG